MTVGDHVVMEAGAVVSASQIGSYVHIGEGAIIVSSLSSLPIA